MCTVRPTKLDTYSGHETPRGDPQLPLMNSSMMHRGAVYQRGFEHCVTLSTPIKTQRGDRHVCFTHPNNKHINASKRH